MTINDIKVQWDLIQLQCEHCGSDLEIKEGPWGCFYSCTDYPNCYNRMNVEIYEKILDEITEVLNKYDNINLTGYKWEFRTSYQNYEFKIEKQLPERFIVSVNNLKKRRRR